MEKYGIFDYRGGGRASARETACRVAAGAIAKKLLSLQNIQITASIKQIGSIVGDGLTTEMCALLEEVKREGNSIGGLVEFVATSVPVGLGDPVYEKLGANLAFAMMSIPAAKSFEIGSGFGAVEMQGSEHNDLFAWSDKVETLTNHAGGLLGGISNGMPLIGRVRFKPASSIMKPQATITTSRESSTFQLPDGSRHDPCVAIRAVPVVEAMVALVLIDAMLLNKCVKL